jgi:hypothetical protein
MVIATLVDDVIRVDAPNHPMIHDKLFEATDWDENVADGTYSTMVTYVPVPAVGARPSGLLVRFDQDPVPIAR